MVVLCSHVCTDLDLGMGIDIDINMYTASQAKEVMQTRSHSGFGQRKRHWRFLDMQSNVMVHKTVKDTV